MEAPSAPVLPDRVREFTALGPDPTIIPEDDDDIGDIGPVYLPEETAPVVAELDDEDLDTPPTPLRRPPTLSDEFGIPDAPPPVPISVGGEELEGPAPVEFPRAQPGRVPAAQRPGFRPPTADAILPPEEDETEDRSAPPASSIGNLRPAQASDGDADEEEEHGPYWGRIIVAALLLFGLVGGVMKVLFGSDDGDPALAKDDPPTDPVQVDPPTDPIPTPPVVPPTPPTNVEVPVVQPVPPVVPPTNPVTPPVVPPTNPVTPPNHPTPPVNNVKPPPGNPTGNPTNPVTPPPPAVAALRISVTPSTASLTVDGTPLASGATSWSGAPGRHLVSGKAPGYKSMDKSIDLVASGGDVALVLEKEISSGVVKLFGTPGSQVFLGDMRIDSLPAQIELAEGTYTFRVVMPDQSSYTVQKVIKFNAAGQPLNVSLAPN